MKKKILVCEDEQIIALDLKTTLQHWGYDVIAVVKKGEDVLKYTKRDNPDLLILDAILDGKITGMENVNSMLTGKNIPIIYLTGSRYEQFTNKDKSPAPVKYIAKPFSNDELKEAIDDLVSNSLNSSK